MPKSSYPTPWWLDNDDTDLQRTNGGMDVGGDDDNVSTSSSLYIEDTQTEQQRQRSSQYTRMGGSSSPTTTKSSTTHRPSVATSLSPPTQRRQKQKAWTSETGQAKANHDGDYSLKHQKGPSDRNKGESRNSNNSSNSSNSSSTGVVQWNCEACTYTNVKTIAQQSKHVTCDVCGTPHMVPSRSSMTDTTTMKSSRRSNTNNNRTDLPVDPVEVIEQSLLWDQDNEAASHVNDDTRQSRSRNTPSPLENVSAKWNKLRSHIPFLQTKQRTNDPPETGTEQSGSGHTRTPSNSDGISETSLGTTTRHYSVHELVASLGENDVELPPALERRVRDFKFAQAKRKEKHGDQKPWGIYGLYAHLSDIRADLEWAEDAAWRRQRGQPYLSWKDFDNSRDHGLRNRPLFTYGVVFLCTVMMFVTFGVNGWKFEPLDVNPLIGPSSDTLIKCGARDTSLIVNDGQWFRLFTPMILHAGLIHYFINMMALYFIGGAVEHSHGFASTAILFIIPAVGGNILSAICLPQYISVGASGGIFGMMGGCIADICLNWNLLFLKTATDGDTRNRHFYVLLYLGLDIIINALLGFTPFVDNFTHLGGFMYGFCCGISTIERLAVGFFGISTEKCSQLGHTIMRSFGLIISVIVIMVTTIVLVQMDGTTSPCPGCRYISCIPFPPNASEKWWYCDDCETVTADLFRDGDGSGLYEQINIHCPNGDVEEVEIAVDGIYDKEDLRRALPSYCRAHCDSVFAT